MLEKLTENSISIKRASKEVGGEKSSNFLTKTAASAPSFQWKLHHLWLVGCHPSVGALSHGDSIEFVYFT